ncbi:hypothetical protein BKA93DRAFT_723582 [Sparassis latifolia]
MSVTASVVKPLSGHQQDPNIHPELQILRTELHEVHDGMARFGPTLSRPPILDSSIGLNSKRDGAEDTKEAVPGLRALRESVRRDLDATEKFLSDPRCASLPPLSTNAPYLISVWNEVLLARPPILTIEKAFPEQENHSHLRRRGSQKPPGVKVDVVADDGRHWIRVNTITNSRILAEFREIDSYLTDSEDESDNPHGGERPSLAQTQFDNSVLRMGRALLAAAKKNPIAGTPEIPHVTMRLTRLEISPAKEKEHDPRIAQTIQVLRDMGIDVQLGERDKSILPTVSEPLPPSVPPPLEPTTRINLDLSTLIALVSDITHSPLPLSVEEANARFVPSPEYREWKRKRLETVKGSAAAELESTDLEDGPGRHSQALINQALQEMGKGLLQEIHDQLAALASSSGKHLSQSPTVSLQPSSIPTVEFWTTREARDRCLKIVLSKIGGPNEKRRAQALFPDTASLPMAADEAIDAYWLHSRYSRAFIPLLPIRVFSSSEPDQDLTAQSNGKGENTLQISPFFSLLAWTCRDVLAQETIPLPGAASSPHTPDDGDMAGEPASAADELEDDDDGEIQRAVVTRANSRLTAHTVQSLLWGAVRGWTTLTANKSSVKAILREMKAARGTQRQGWEHEVHTDGGSQASQDGEGHAGDGEVVAEKAALWLVDPRSLAEGMRSDRDYS